MIRIFIPDSRSGFFSFRISDFREQKTTEQEKWGFEQILSLANKLGLLYILLFRRIDLQATNISPDHKNV
jgi:hypothetical protein